MKITTALIDKLIRLAGGESLPASQLRGEWVDELLREGQNVRKNDKTDKLCQYNK